GVGWGLVLGRVGRRAHFRGAGPIRRRPGNGEEGRGAAVLAGLGAKGALFWEIRGYHTHVPRTGALFAMQHNGWDHALKVTADGSGLVGHAGAVLLRKAADQAGLTRALGAALRKAGTAPLFDRGVVLVSLATAIAARAP